MIDSTIQTQCLTQNQYNTLVFEAKIILGITPEEDRESVDLALTGDFSKFNEISMRVLANIDHEIAPLQSKFDCSIIKYTYDEFEKIDGIRWGDKCDRCKGTGMCQCNCPNCESDCEVCMGERYKIGSKITTDIAGEIKHAIE